MGVIDQRGKRRYPEGRGPRGGTVDTGVLNTPDLGRAGSSPAVGTIDLYTIGRNIRQGGKPAAISAAVARIVRMDFAKIEQAYQQRCDEEGCGAFFAAATQLWGAVE